MLAATVALGPVRRKAVSMTKFGLCAAVLAASSCVVHATLHARRAHSLQLTSNARPGFGPLLWHRVNVADHLQPLRACVLMPNSRPSPSQQRAD